MFRFFLFCLLLLPQLSIAQRRPLIVKDNVKCLYGLKNDSNEWIVQPQYITLKEQAHFFIAGNAQSKYGMYNSRGQLVLPVEYEQIVPIASGRFAPNIFIVTKDTKSGIVDSTGKETLPLLYDKILLVHLAVYPHQYFVLKKGEQEALIDNTLKYFVPFSDYHFALENYIPWKVRVMDKEGRYGLADSTGIVLAPTYKSIKSLDEHRSAFPDYLVVTDFTSQKKGLINSHGDTLLSFRYESITAAETLENRIIVRTENTYGLYDATLQVIIPEGSQCADPQDYYTRYEDHIPTHSYDTLPVRRDNKWGLMTGNGVWVTKQEYDTIMFPDFVPDYSRGHFIVKANGKYGVIDPAGKIKIPIEYEMLAQCSDKSTSSGGGGCVRIVITNGTFFFVGKKNGFYGATRSNGANFIPYIYDTIFTKYDLNSGYYRTSSGARYVKSDLYFTGNAKALYLERASESTNNQSLAFPLTYFFDADKEVKVYKDNHDYFSRYYPFREIQVGNKRMLAPAVDADLRVSQNNSELLEFHLTSDYYSEPQNFDRKTGKPVVDPLKGVRLVGKAGFNHIFQSAENKLGIISPQGQVLLKPAYIGLSYVTSYVGKEYLWTKISQDTLCGAYDPKSDCACGWRLCNMNGVPVSPIVFDLPQKLTEEVMPMVVDGKLGLFNVGTLKFVSAVIYKDITPFCNKTSNYINDGYGCRSSLFYAIRDNGQFGIMNPNGKWVTDSTFEYMIPYPRRNFTVASTNTTGMYAVPKWLMVSSTGTVMVDAIGQMTSDSLMIDSLILQSFNTNLNQYNSGYREAAYTQKGPHIEYLYKRRLMPGEQITVKQDSLYLEALKAGNELVMELFGYRAHRIPGSYSISASACIVGPWTGESTTYFKTSRSRDAEHLKAEIVHYSDKAISLIVSFNPDTARAAKGNAYPYLLNFEKSESGEYIPVTLDSIFCPTVQWQFALNKLISEAVKKRNDINIDCGNEDAFFARTQGRFFLSDTGLVFYLQNAYIGIPWKQLQPYSRIGGIVDRYLGHSNGDHCRPAYDTTNVNFTAEGFSQVGQLQSTGYLSRQQVKTYRYIFTDSSHTEISGIRFCNGTDMVFDAYFKPFVPKKNPGIGVMPYSPEVRLPKAIRKRNILNFQTIRHYPCE